MRKAIGLIETIGLAAAIDAADVAVKSANVEVIGTEYTKGDGMVVVKIEGDVGAVNAGVEAARQSASRIGTVFSYKVIPRPSAELELFLPKEEASEDLEVEDAEENSIESLALSDIQQTSEPTEAEEVPSVETALIEETQEVEESEESDEMVITCNICNDPRCSRKKGDLHMMCLHYLD